MARLRIRIELNKGRRGIFLHKLGGIGEESAKFLRMLGEDLGFDEPKSKWLAVNFHDGSLSFDVENAGEPSESEIAKYNAAFSRVIDYDPSEGKPLVGIRPATVRQYVQIADSIDQDEHVSFGLYINGEDSPTQWEQLSKKHAQIVVEHFEQPILYEGFLQGRIHALYKGATPPYLQVRELSSSDLVKCIYSGQQYEKIISLLKNKDAVIHVFGLIKARSTDGKIEELRIEDAKEAPFMTPSEFDKFFGCAPDITGDVATEEFIDKVREGE